MQIPRFANGFKNDRWNGPPWIRESGFTPTSSCYFECLHLTHPEYGCTVLVSQKMHLQICKNNSVFFVLQNLIFECLFIRERKGRRNLWICGIGLGIIKIEGISWMREAWYNFQCREYHFLFLATQIIFVAGLSLYRKLVIFIFFEWKVFRIKKTSSTRSERRIC